MRTSHMGIRSGHQHVLLCPELLVPKANMPINFARERAELVEFGVSFTGKDDVLVALQERRSYGHVYSWKRAQRR